MRCIRPWSLQPYTIRGSGRGTFYVKLERNGFNLIGADDGLGCEAQHELDENKNEYIIRIRAIKGGSHGNRK